MIYIHKPCGYQWVFEHHKYCENCGLKLQPVDLAERGMTFYEQYRHEHSNRWNRLLHLAGLLFGIWHVVDCFVFGHYWQMILAPVVTYATAWLGHLIQGNWPMSFRHPVKSAAAYWRMMGEIITKL